MISYRVAVIGHPLQCRVCMLVSCVPGSSMVWLCTFQGTLSWECLSIELLVRLFWDVLLGDKQMWVLGNQKTTCRDKTQLKAACRQVLVTSS